MISRLLALLGAAALLGAVGCGNKGPLYLPKPATAGTALPATATPPQRHDG